jgi:hypothetical protein
MVFDRILKEIPEGLVLYTPVQRKQFKVKSKEPERLVFFTGKTNIGFQKLVGTGYLIF